MLPTCAVFELCMLEHLKHGVKHDHVALQQPTIVQGCPLRIRDFFIAHLQKTKNLFLTNLYLDQKT